MKNQSGVTLMELMIVVAVIGILAAIAYPSYRDQVLRSHRSDAKVSLERLAQTLERCYTNSPSPKTYAGCVTATVPSENGYYSIAVAPTATSFTLIATALGGQLADSDCRTLTIDNANARTAKTAADVPNDACWRR